MSKAAVLRRELNRKIREVGFRETAKLCMRKLFLNRKPDGQDVHPFDLQYGTDTSGIIKPGVLDIPNDKAVHAVQYQTAIVEVFLEMLSSLPIRFEDFLFIDLGSGKGRALLLASRYPFKGIRGVELSCQLHETACRNIKIFNDECQKCSDIESVNNDAADFKFPDENTVFYLFNPFDEVIMLEFLMNIECSIQKNPRQIYIIYLKPLHRNVFDRSSRFEIYKESERYLIYRSLHRRNNN